MNIDRYLELERTHFWRIGKRRLIASVLSGLLSTGEPRDIIDIGGAESLLIPVLSRFGYIMRADPVSPNADMCDSLPNLLSIHMQYDLVTLFDVLEHVEQDVASLRTIYSKLRPGGRLMMTVPAYQWLYSGHDKALGHHRRYTSRNLRKMLEAAGFHVERITYWTTLLFPLMVAQRLASKWIGRNDGTYHVSIPPRFINWLFGKIMDVERWLLRRVNMPFGGCILVVARKKSPARAGDERTI